MTFNMQTSGVIWAHIWHRDKLNYSKFKLMLFKLNFGEFGRKKKTQKYFFAADAMLARREKRRKKNTREHMNEGMDQ